ncbi:Uncharacterised protein [Mycobacteroides abscessus]|uniref:DNA (cytosine-5-)-methyltransferase n=1 Tax=Mycolicibacterium llatzerense TaxID=280871 RepID=A0A0D1IWB6_9MYCO|nr:MULTISPECIES: DNA cytosine methyltransferase [Mycobacteriaceae]KIU13643.1 hypothetical protein TL10_28805 [Mycolicibacterium llatzerense]MCT7372581.1 hypothetical protein [Mycolicibacterium llatzerense]WGI35826.1 DNA cytosine methyltransferase [Mycolicibacterium aubagnense]CPT78048.1 Uncharacterised protein [Mycobacteroides abscessus]CPU63224.1 Uncharacterised protein [Mycobacteroides abscessus]
MTSTAEFRPALGKRRFAHDDLVAVDLFSGFGGLTRGIAQAGFTTICAAIHWSTERVGRYPSHINFCN